MPEHDFHRELVALLPRLRAQALALTRDRSAAEDLVQDTVANALRGREGRERVAERQLLGDRAASRRADQKADRDRNPEADEERPSGPCPDPPPRDRGRGGEPAPAGRERHASPRYEARTRSLVRSAWAVSERAILPVSIT